MLNRISKSFSKFFTEYKTLMKNSVVMKIIFAGFISSFGTKISYLALLRKVSVLSGGKITDLGFLTIIEIIPSVLFGIIAGTIIDKFPRKKIMIFSDILSGLTILGAIFINDLKYIYILAFIKATINIFRMPAQNAFLPNTVKKDDIPLLNSFKASTDSLIQIISFAVGGVIVAFFGMKNAFIIDALTYWASASIILTVSIKELHLKQNENIKSIHNSTKSLSLISLSDLKNSLTDSLTEFVDAISIVWKNNKIKLMVLINTFVTFAMYMQGILIYHFIRETLRMGDKAEMAWGILLSALGIGAIVGSFILGVKVKHHSNPFKLYLNILIFDASILCLFAINTFFPLSIFFFTLLGVMSAANRIIFNSMLQKSVNDSNRGKVFSALGMLYEPIGALSIFLGTSLAAVITAQMVLIIAAVIEALISIGIRFTASFKKVDRELHKSSVTSSPFTLSRIFSSKK